jgi:hypothetical protein
MRLAARFWLVSFGVAGVVAVLIARAVQVDLDRQGIAAGWWDILKTVWPSMTLWALAGPLMVAFGYARPLAGVRVWRHAALHAAAGLGWVLGATALAAFATAAFTSSPMPDLGEAMFGAPLGLVADAGIYAALAGLGTMLVWRDRAHDASARVQALALERSRLEAELARGELHVLRARLQPHFLFNALNAVGSLARKGDTRGAIAVVAGLGDLLRAAIEGQRRDAITLGEELALVHRYLEIQRVRYGDALRWVERVDPEALPARVPCLLLQPLVENAVVHGIERQSDAGPIHVVASRRGPELVIVIRNDGVTLPAGWSGEASRGEGLALTRDRLALRFPGRHELIVANADGGIEATIRMPFESDGPGRVAGVEEPAHARADR